MHNCPHKVLLEHYRDQDEEEDDSEPADSCESCGGNIYPFEDDGSGLCDQCQWYAEHGASQSNEDVL